MPSPGTTSRTVHLPALLLGVARVHAVEHVGPVLGLQAAGAGVHGEDGVACRRSGPRTTRSISSASSITASARERVVGLGGERLVLARQLERRTGVLQKRRRPRRTRGWCRAGSRPASTRSARAPRRPRSPGAALSSSSRASSARLSSMCRYPRASLTRCGRLLDVVFAVRHGRPYASASVAFLELRGRCRRGRGRCAPRSRRGRRLVLHDTCAACAGAGFGTARHWHAGAAAACAARGAAGDARSRSAPASGDE